MRAGYQKTSQAEIIRNTADTPTAQNDNAVIITLSDEAIAVLAANKAQETIEPQEQTSIIANTAFLTTELFDEFDTNEDEEVDTQELFAGLTKEAQEEKARAEQAVADALPTLFEQTVQAYSAFQNSGENNTLLLSTRI